MRRSFAYSIGQPDEAVVRADVARIVEGFPVKRVDLQPWESGGFHVRVELDLPEEVEHVRRDVEAVVREFPGGQAVEVKDSGPFGDISWPPFSTRDICLGEYVTVLGSKRQAIVWQLFDECRYVMGPADYNLRDPWFQDSCPELRTAVLRVLDFVVNGIFHEHGRHE